MSTCHCEAKGRLRPSSTGYGDEAIESGSHWALDCFAALAMTVVG
jgi:hypothetical protein